MLQKQFNEPHEFWRLLRKWLAIDRNFESIEMNTVGTSNSLTLPALGIVLDRRSVLDDLGHPHKAVVVTLI